MVEYHKEGVTHRDLMKFGAAAGSVCDVAADGKRFLMIRNATNVSPTERPQFIIVQNWFEELKRLVPTDGEKRRSRTGRKQPFKIDEI